MNVFDIIGPVMIGPSSSHTAGAARIGRIGLSLLNEPVIEAKIFLYGSFANTYKGHGTDRALAAGIMGMSPEDPRLRNSLELARSKGISIQFETCEQNDAHPNTAKLILTGISKKSVSLEAASIGGGNVQVTEVNGLPVSFTCEHPTLLVVHMDIPGMIAMVSDELSKSGVNICSFHLARSEKGGMAIMTIETDGEPNEQILRQLEKSPNIQAVTYLKSI